MRKSLLSKLPGIIRCARNAGKRPKDGNSEILPNLSPEEVAAVDSLDAMCTEGAMGDEAKQITLRLIAGVLWTSDAAQDGHHLAKGLGKIFDSCIAALSAVRELADRVLGWANLTLAKCGAARLRALSSETAHPTEPRPPPWNPALSHGPEAVEEVAPRLPLFPPIPTGLRRAATAKSSWYDRCNRTGLKLIYDSARNDLTSLSANLGVSLDALEGKLSIAIRDTNATKGTKQWLLDVLVSLGLRYEQIAPYATLPAPPAPDPTAIPAAGHGAAAHN